jgi:hypothetical protein
MSAVCGGPWLGVAMPQESGLAGTCVCGWAGGKLGTLREPAGPWLPNRLVRLVLRRGP